MTQKTSQNPWSLDVRVRERNLKSGMLTEKDLDKHLAGLPDVADQAEPFSIGQPALADQARHVAETGGGADADEGAADDVDEGDGSP